MMEQIVTHPYYLQVCKLVSYTRQEANGFGVLTDHIFSSDIWLFTHRHYPFPLLPVAIHVYI